MSGGTDLAPIEGQFTEQHSRADLALFGTEDPAEIIAKATQVADVLKSVIDKKGLIQRIGDNEYVDVEGWQTLATLTSVSPVLEWTRKTDDGWEARVQVVNRNGMVIGAGEAQCGRSERNWKNRDDFAIRSMAQTRATSKALRSVLAFIMVLAGYQPTPAAEMPAAQPAENARKPMQHVGGSDFSGSDLLTEKQGKALFAIGKAQHISTADMKAFAKAASNDRTEKIAELTVDEASALIKQLNARKEEVPPDVTAEQAAREFQW